MIILCQKDKNLGRGREGGRARIGDKAYRRPGVLVRHLGRFWIHYYMYILLSFLLGARA